MQCEFGEALRQQGFDVHPKYLDLKFTDRQRPSRLPNHDNINHYDTFNIRQEIELAIQGKNYSSDGFWGFPADEINERAWAYPGIPRWGQIYQDPYRRLMFAADMEALIDLSAKVASCISQGLAVSDVVILTLGLTECWRHKETGLFVCDGPKNEQDRRYGLLEFYPSSFQENYENISSTIDSIWTAYPNKKIVLTVSPVPLGRTWTNQDVIVANMTSKSTLRAVAAQVCRDHPEIIYWPSFEFSLKEDVYEPDGRHIAKDAVKRIVDAFLDAHAF